VIGPVLGAALAAGTYLAVMEASNRSPVRQAPEIGESAIPPGGAVGAP
jgi:hypothetical protein